MHAVQTQRGSVGVGIEWPVTGHGPVKSVLPERVILGTGTAHPGHYDDIAPF